MNFYFIINKYINVIIYDLSPVCQVNDVVKIRNYFIMKTHPEIREANDS